MTSHDGSRLFVDGEQVVRNGGLHGVLRATGQVDLGRGYHLLRVDYFKNEGVGVMAVQWNGPDTLHKDAMLDGFHFESMLTPVASKGGGQDKGVQSGSSVGIARGRGRLPAGSSSADGSSRRGRHSEQDTEAPATTRKSGIQGTGGLGAGGGGGGEGEGRSGDAVKAPKVDNKALGVPQPPPPAASHPAPTIPYDSPSRYNKEHEEGATEDPFHFREVSLWLRCVHTVVVMCIHWMREWIRGVRVSRAYAGGLSSVMPYGCLYDSIPTLFLLFPYLLCVPAEGKAGKRAAP